jgi:hypothetical protein
MSTLTVLFERSGRPTLDAAEWQVYGRVAEAYGFREVAKRAYGRAIDRPEPSLFDSAWLAKKRLQGLKKRK